MTNINDLNERDTLKDEIGLKYWNKVVRAICDECAVYEHDATAIAYRYVHVLHAFHLKKVSAADAGRIIKLTWNDDKPIF